MAKWCSRVAGLVHLSANRYTWVVLLTYYISHTRVSGRVQPVDIGCPRPQLWVCIPRSFCSRRFFQTTPSAESRIPRTRSLRLRVQLKSGCRRNSEPAGMTFDLTPSTGTTGAVEPWPDVVLGGSEWSIAARWSMPAISTSTAPPPLYFDRPGTTVISSQLSKVIVDERLK